MIWMLDTDTCIHFLNRGPGYTNVARRMSGRASSRLRLSAITLSELEYGIENSRDRDDNRATLLEFLSLTEIEDYPAGAARHFAEIKRALKTAGRMIGAYDLLIAAHARCNDDVLVTNNLAEFSRVPGLRTENWLKN